MKFLKTLFFFSLRNGHLWVAFADFPSFVILFWICFYEMMRKCFVVREPTASMDLVLLHRFVSSEQSEALVLLFVFFFFASSVSLHTRIG